MDPGQAARPPRERELCRPAGTHSARWLSSFMAFAAYRNGISRGSGPGARKSRLSAVMSFPETGIHAIARDADSLSSICLDVTVQFDRQRDGPI